MVIMVWIMTGLQARNQANGLFPKDLASFVKAAVRSQIV